MSVFFLWLLPIVARLHPHNRDPDDREYPQLWTCMPFWPPARSFIQWMCGVIVGHEASKTEWEWDGGDFIERHCRWCDASIMIPKDEEPTRRDWLKGLWDENEELTREKNDEWGNEDGIC